VFRHQSSHQLVLRVDRERHDFSADTISVSADGNDVEAIDCKLLT
jgi:hypothetical protein